jgi:hypothetical protein
MASICVNAIHACIRLIRAGIITLNAVSVKDSSPITVADRQWVPRYVRQAGQGENDDSRKVATVAPPGIYL